MAILAEKARQDIRNIEKYFLDNNLEVFNDLLDCIFSTISRLDDFKNSGRAGRIGGTREIVMTEYPYILPYIVRNEEVFILRVLHHRQKPKL